MNRLARAVAVLGFGLWAGTAAAQGGLAVGGGDCGSPNLSKSVGKSFVMKVDKPCISFLNDVGRLAELTIGTSAAFPHIRVLPQSELKSVEITHDGHRLRVFGGEVTAKEIAIRIEPLDAPLTVTIHGFRRASTAPHTSTRPPAVVPRVRAAVARAAPAEAPAGPQGVGDAKARRTSE